jgi:hypothetical protein
MATERSFASVHITTDGKGGFQYAVA